VAGEGHDRGPETEQASASVFGTFVLVKRVNICTFVLVKQVN
jgi:hypothetical protein